MEHLLDIQRQKWNWHEIGQEIKLEYFKGLVSY